MHIIAAVGCVSKCWKCWVAMGVIFVDGVVFYCTQGIIKSCRGFQGKSLVRYSTVMGGTVVGTKS